MKFYSKHKLAGVAVITLLIVSMACSDRKRTNPLDPGNPDIDRSNIGFNALAGSNRVLLEWDRLDFIDLAGVRVQRIEAGTTDTVTVTDTTLAFTATRFIDNTSDNGVTYSYHLAFDVTGSEEKPTTLPDTVTPGPVFSWMELIDFGEVVLFTPDFRDEVVSLDAAFIGVVDIQVSSTVWVLDSDGTVHRFQRNGELIGSELINVSAFTFNPFDRSAWVAAAGESGQVFHFQENGDVINSKLTNIRVTSLAADVIGNDLWIGSSDPIVAKLNTASSSNTVTEYTHSEFSKPELVVTSRGVPGVWIGDRGSNKVFNLNTAGMVWSSSGFSEVNDVAVDDDGEFCWVADAIADEVTILNGRNGNVIDKLSGFGNPFYLVYNRETQTVLVSGSSGLITNFDLDGQVQWQIQNPDRTGKIAPAY